MLLNPNSYIIFGAGGQDGIYLTKELIKKNKKIIFISNTIKKKHLDESITNYNKIEFIKGDYFNNKFYKKIINKYDSENLIFFYGYTSVKNSKLEKQKCIEMNTMPIFYLLEEVKMAKKKHKLLYANTCEIFSKDNKFKNENSKILPENIYALSKSLANNLLNFYERNYSLNIFNIIFFNHDSYYRGSDFLYREIKKQFQKSKNNTKKIINVKNKFVCRDWGHAQEYMYIIYRLLKTNKFGKYVITNENNFSVEELIYKYGKFLNIDKKNIEIHSQNTKKSNMRGKSNKIRRLLNYNFKKNHLDVFKEL